MIQFNYSNDNNVSTDRKEKAKQAFIEKLGVLREEFEAKNGLVTINFSSNNNDEFDYTFDIENRQDFIDRWNECIRQHKNEQE